MNAIHLENLELVTPNEAEALLAQETSRRLAAFLGEEPEYRIQLLDGGQPSETLAVPAVAMRMFVHLLSEIAKGHAVTLIPIDAELSTNQAADLLNVSRPYLIQLLEKGEVPFHKVGAHRRVKFNDLIAYKQEIDARRRQALDELAEDGQRLGMGY
jgi:excisionase family DNA binding protein